MRVARLAGGLGQRLISNVQIPRFVTQHANTLALTRMDSLTLAQATKQANKHANHLHYFPERWGG
jgi:hypothetical protein